MVTTTTRCFIEIHYLGRIGKCMTCLGHALLSGLPPQFSGDWDSVRRNKFGAWVFKHDTDKHVLPAELKSVMRSIKAYRKKVSAGGWVRVYLKNYTWKEIK